MYRLYLSFVESNSHGIHDYDDCLQYCRTKIGGTYIYFNGCYLTQQQSNPLGFSDEDERLFKVRKHGRIHGTV